MRVAPIILLSLLSLTARAQYDQSINVEGKYVPEYIGHDRIGIFPRQVKFPLEESSLQYSMQGVNADFTPNAIPLQVTGWQINRKPSAHRGYVELGLGSWLESTLSAGYRFIDTSASSLGIRLQHNSTSLWNPKISEAVDTRMWRYDESLALYGHHTFEDYGRLEAAVDYRLGNFNYYGFDPVYALDGKYDRIKAPTQTLNDVAAKVTWQAAARAGRPSWNVGAGVRYFGFRSYYGQLLQPEWAVQKGVRETDVNVNGAISYATSAKSSIGLELNADILLYGKPGWKSEVTYGTLLPELDNLGMLSLTPYYRYTRDRLNIRIGAKVDLAFDAGPATGRYDLFHISPSVRVDYNAGPAKLYLHALGGSALHTAVAGYQNNYYQTPAIASTMPVYTPLDARVGVSFGPFAGFNAGFDVAYKTSRGQYFSGFYQEFLNGNEVLLRLDLPKTIDGRPVTYSFHGGTSNLSGFSTGINIGYDSGRYFKVTAEGRYQRQDGKTGYFNGYDRPEWTAAVKMETNPWSTLKFRLGYELRAMRMMPVAAEFSIPDATLDNDLIVMYRLPNMSLLNFGASYGINRNLSVWLQANNLLNREWYYMAGLPQPGICITAGLGIYF